jgi:putative endopeptidase
MEYGRGWRFKYRDEALRHRIPTGRHSPAMCRVLGVVVNVPECHEAFGIRPGDPMYRSPEERVRIR